MNNPAFADRISDVPKSFIREILKVAVNPEMISFAGGLPNRDLFPVKELQNASNQVFETAGKEALQYSNSEGYLPLREFIAKRYADKAGLKVSPDNILITCGSQQGLDLLAKIILNEGDDVLIEEPGYLGAIQVFSVYRSTFVPIPLLDDGLDAKALTTALQSYRPKLLYTVPNFSNPSGITYSLEKRREIAAIIEGYATILVEDNPYGDLRYRGEDIPSFKHFLPEQTILLGSFSKTAVPGFRIGWIVAPDAIMDKLIVAKQAADLHTNIFTQRLLYQYLSDNDLEAHIRKIREVYGRQGRAMIESIRKHFPSDVHFTTPDGGMFLWVTLPPQVSSMKLFDLAIKRNVAFVPGNPFYTYPVENINTLRLNFSCVDEKTIEVGIAKLGEAIKELLGN
ncbi:MAG: PLP-dependent aminotransferase family protein [Deltaproteobacteria bacterium]|nr:PLP-dependent aminotransferase family protein [Deltaproteobacteria bacterium]